MYWVVVILLLISYIPLPFCGVHIEYAQNVPSLKLFPNPKVVTQGE